MKKLLIILVLMPVFMQAQGAFYDMTTEQFGAYLRQEITVLSPVHATIGLRHQKNLTRADILLGSDHDISGVLIGTSVGISIPFQEFSGQIPHGTAILNIKYPVSDYIGIQAHYQPTLNNSLIGKKVQHQVGVGIFLTLKQ